MVTNIDTQSTDKVKPRVTRSAVTNGSRLFRRPPKNKGRLRRFRDLIDEVSRPLGGFASLSEAKKQSVRRVAALSMSLEDSEERLVEGAVLDPESFARSSMAQNRLLQGLGLLARNGAYVGDRDGDGDGDEPRHFWDLSRLNADELDVLYGLALKAGVDLIEGDDGTFAREVGEDSRLGK